jgi:diguanylate cyclase (GGDEF)-like protein/PAS domain S-box-containing protein
MQALSATVKTLRERIAPWFQSWQAEEPVAATFRARQLQAVLRLTPLTMTANVLNVVLVTTAFWHSASRLFLLLWGASVLLLATVGLRAWLRWRERGDWHSASPASLRRATRNATALALMWALVPLVLFPGADGPQQLLLATVTTGMMCAGGFALATTPVAGTAYVAVLGVAAAAALLRADFPLALPVGGLLLVYCLIVLASVWSTARLFGARLMAEAEAERQNEVIGLLLRDFEEHASDVLWEIDSRGHLCHVSPRLVRLFGVPAEQLAGRPVADWLQELIPDDEAAAAQLEQLRRHIATGTPFRDLTLPATRGGRTRWWSLTAKPLVDAQGGCTGWRGVSTDITDAHRANRQLTWLAHYDPLTGLANRHHFRSQLSELLTPADGSPPAFAVLCLDLDHFKTINDTLGHAIGDGLLQEVARRLQSRTRRSDTVARLGGDEFAVILRQVTSAAEAELLTLRLLEGLQAPCEVQGTRIAVRTSIGVAMAPRDGLQIDTLLNNADLALYAAKSAGRGEFRFFAPQMAALTRRRLIIEQALRQALARQELSLHFQPQVSLVDQRITGFEALLRWRHDELGDVSPTEFVPVAEEAGLIVEIGSWVLQQACSEASTWPEALTVSVNVSPVQAMSPDLCRAALQAVQASGLAPGRLEVEITESIFLHETRATMDVLRSLREAGVRIALDDFGTGYSSLAYLRRFPFDTLKIDRSFVRELSSRRDARAIVKMIVGLARTLNMKVVAEGVEEASQAAVLRRYGCDALQGYLAARPMPAAQLPAFLADWAARPAMDWPDTGRSALLPLGGGA